MKKYPCDLVFSEKESGKTTRNRLAPGDVFVVAEWDRATRSMMDGIALMTCIHAAVATIVVLDRKALDLTTPMGKALLGLFYPHGALTRSQRQLAAARLEPTVEPAVATTDHQILTALPVMPAFHVATTAGWSVRLSFPAPMVASVLRS